MVALLLYAYARGVRSARKIERACEEDVAFKTIAMMETPDHATIARFVDRHEAALGELFGQVLRLCDEAGLVRPGVVAIDGTRLAGNASRESTRDFAQIAREILAEAKAVDEAEDELYGEARGDELPEQLRTREGRAEFFRQARERRAAGSEVRVSPAGAATEPELEFETERIVARRPGTRGVDARRATSARAPPLGATRSGRALARGAAAARRRAVGGRARRAGRGQPGL